MPKNSKVGKMYDALRREGMSKAKAAKIAQAKTGQALATGRPAKTHGGKPTGTRKATPTARRRGRR